MAAFIICTRLTRLSVDSNVNSSGLAILEVGDIEETASSQIKEVETYGAENKTRPYILWRNQKAVMFFLYLTKLFQCLNKPFLTLHE